MKNSHTDTDNRYRWQIALRVAVAILGGYALANSAGILLSYLLPIPKGDAVMTGILLSFAIYAGAIMWVFAARSVRKACVGIIAPALLSGGIALLLKFTGVAP